MVDYKAKIKAEGEFWGRESRAVCELGIPLSVDYRKASSISRDKGAYWDDFALDQFVRGKYRKLVIATAAKKGGKALDLCCGTGWLSLELARSGFEVMGMDVSVERLRIAVEYGEKQVMTPPAKLTYRETDLNNVIFTPLQYDVVTAWDGLHHIQNAERLVEQIKTGLKPGGYFIIFESLHRSLFNEQLAKILWFVLPNKIAYAKKFKRAVNRLRGNAMPQSIDESPFEDITGLELIGEIKKHLTIRHHEQCLALLPILAGSFSYEKRLQRWALYFIKSLDQIATKTGLLRGSYHYLVAQKC